MIGTYDVEVVTPPCDPGSARLVAKALLAADIGPVLPYLNAILPGANYMPEATSLTWTDDGHTIAFHSHEIAVSDIDDRDDAQQVIEDLVGLVNRTWRRRTQIVPSVASRRRPTPMAVYGLLPKSNCTDCGLPNCWQFALKLVIGEVTTRDCPGIAQPKYASELAALRRLVTETSSPA